MRVVTTACACAAVVFGVSMVSSVAVSTQSPRERPGVTTLAAPTEAPAGFDGLTNGFVTQAEMDEAAIEFTGPETPADGLGPVFNGAACGECHSVPRLGGSSQITERRAGFFDGATFFDHPGGSLIQDRATDPRVQERVLPGHNVITLRSSLSVLGDGFVESIDAGDLFDLANSQPASVRGQFIQVPVLEAGTIRGGRFGWKNQHASLLSFAADAYKNEMSITSPLQPDENTFNGAPLPPGLDPKPDPEDATGADVELFAKFMRATKVPPVDAVKAASADAQAGSTLFTQIGCATCHVRTFTTAPAGTAINGGAFTVPDALGNKLIHPFTDFLLHDIGTGDGIVQNGGQSTRNKLRTAPLWGLRTRGRFMHDQTSMSVDAAIRRHAGQALSIRQSFEALSSTNRARILAFLDSL